MLVVAVFVLFSVELSLREAKHERILAEALAEKDAVITEKETEIAEKTEALKAWRDEATKLKARKVVLDENGVRTDRMREIYLTADPYRESEVQTDAEFREWCRENYPEAVLPADVWTAGDALTDDVAAADDAAATEANDGLMTEVAEKVLASWTEKPEIWGVWRDSYNDLLTYFSWTPDYEHCFYLDIAEPIIPVNHETGEHKELVSGWLVMDGVRMAMIDAKTYAIDDPYEMLRQYQAGEWDGEARRSHDGSTVAEVAFWHGTLEYTYEAWVYDETTDPLGVAYEGYATNPWWQRDGLSEELVAALGRNHSQRAWEEGQMRAHDWLWGGGWDFYVDLPGGISAKVEGLGEVYEVEMTGQGTFFATATGVWLYKSGELVDSWALKLVDSDDLNFYAPFKRPKTEEEIARLSATRLFDADDPEATPQPSEQERARDYVQAYADCQRLGLISENDLAYFYTGKQLLVLREGGAAEKFFEEVPERDRALSRGPGRGLKDGRLIYWSSYDLPKVITEDVLKADFTEVALIEKADGCYAIVYGDDGYEARFLGIGSMEHYKRLNALLDRAWVR